MHTISFDYLYTNMTGWRYWLAAYTFTIEHYISRTYFVSLLLS